MAGASEPTVETVLSPDDRCARTRDPEGPRTGRRRHSVLIRMLFPRRDGPTYEARSPRTAARAVETPSRDECRNEMR
jgi:hypothetical protein